MSFTRHQAPSPRGEGAVVDLVADFDSKTKVRIAPYEFMRNWTRVTIPTSAGCYTFNPDELGDFIDELIERWVEVAPDEAAAPIEENARSHPEDIRAGDTGRKSRTVGYLYEPDVPDDDRMRNRLVIPMRVGGILDICWDDDLEDEDVIEFQVPIG